MKLLSTCTSNPQTLFAKLNFLRHISSNTKQQWNTSTTNLPIINPTLLIMESCKNMIQLKQIQAHMTRTGLFFDTFPVSRLLTFCAISDNGDIRYATSIFSQIQRPNTYIWNVLIKGYCKTSYPFLGLSLFRRMVRNEVDLDERSFVYALKACEGVSNDVMGSLVHCLILKFGVVFDLVVCNGLIHFYADFGCVSFARRVFDEMCVKDVVSWTSMIDGYAEKNLVDEAMGLFDLMLVSDVEPNEVTMIAVLSACCKKGDLKVGKSTHDFMRKNDLNHGINLLNALLGMYVNCGCLISAREIFDKMKVKDVYSWTSMVNGYAKFGEVDHARSMFDLMPHKNVVSWNAMIAGYAQNNQPMKALELFNKMVKEGGIVPIESTLVSVLSACAQSGCLDVGQWIHHFYVNQNRIRLSVILANALIDMYSKCGSIEAATKIFHTMPDRDLVSWNSMIVGYASHGYAQKSLNLFEQMINSKKYKPDDITFIGVLSACSHSGLVSEGKEYFKNMKLIFGLDPKIEHYACMIDLLGRNGLLQEAYNLLTNMTMEPDKAAWGALLNACKVSGNVELGMLVAKKLMILDPKDSGIYALLANICSKSKLWDEVKMVRNMMREREIKKTPGCSMIEVEGELHEFLVADESHHRGSIGYASAVRKLAAQDSSSIWKYDRIGSADSVVQLGQPLPGLKLETKSELAAAILGGCYLDSASVTTVSHVSDIVGPGVVYAVEFSH